MSAAFDWPHWRERRLDEFEWALDQALSSAAPTALLEPMRYAALDGGKRMRPLLAFAAAEAVTGLDTEAMSPEQRQAVLQAACAVECVHVYSLMHDDLPCMDDDDLRRGRPTTHVKYGEAMAMLAGDALQTLAFELLSADVPGISARTQVAWVRRLSEASGAVGMCGGQAVDLSAVGHELDQQALEAMHAAKTGALLRAAIVLGAQAVQAAETTIQVLDEAGRDLGLAFQVIDDVLDATADTATLGKTAGKDAANDKPTYVSLMGIDAARSYALALADHALEKWSSNGFVQAHALRALAQQVVQRSH